jgi:hypothetical protein
VATILFLSRDALVLSNIAQARNNSANTKRGTPRPAPIAASWHVLQGAVGLASPDFDVSVLLEDDAAFSDVILASKAWPVITFPLAIVKGSPLPSESDGQVIVEPSEIGDPQQYLETPSTK